MTFKRIVKSMHFAFIFEFTKLSIYFKRYCSKNWILLNIEFALLIYCANHFVAILTVLDLVETIFFVSK